MLRLASASGKIMANGGIVMLVRRETVKEKTMQTTIADVIVTQMEALANHLANVLPWVKHLNDDERAELLADLAQARIQVRQTGHSQVLLEVLEDWEATAQVVGDTRLMARLQTPILEQDYTPWETIRADIPGDPAP
jgi:hypothetical protein